MATVISIVFQPEDKKYERGRFDEFIREPIQKAELIANHGIKGDRKAGRNPQRQLNLLSAGWLADKRSEGYRIKPGQFGEQFIIEGLVLESLNVGDQLQLGDDARVQITMPRVGCERLETAQGAAGLAGKDIGVMARVVSGGEVHLGDVVRVLESVEEADRRQ
jgi:MOSC domain-containing protein YiiM